MRSGVMHWIWFPLVLAGLLVIYLPGLGNHLVFDDALLTDGRLAKYGGLVDLKPRLLSYGSFVWLQELLGQGWWKQRLVNLTLHVGVVLALWGFYRDLLRHIETPRDEPGAATHPPYFLSTALGLAVGVFALNPVAVYGVAYLVQRSIVLATLFVVLSLWCFLRAVAGGRRVYFVFAALFYALALLSKEHAIMAPLAAIPIYIIAARPSGRRLALLSLVGGLLVAAMAAVLAIRYGDIIGKAFDEYSNIYLAQLARLGANVEANAYALSILNQSWLFFKYGVYWLLPNTEWMAIDMRPPFPVSLTGFPHVLGVFAYAAVLVSGSLLVLRYRDGRALVGFSLLLPALLFMTEFSTIWVQDPFVLYRGYLWAIALPGLAFFLFHGLAPRWLLLLGLVLGSLFTWGAVDRVYSLGNPERVWSDAIAKLPDDPRSVGRWFPYLNRAEIHLNSDRLNEARKDFLASDALGDGGLGLYNLGAMLGMLGQYDESLAMLDASRRRGYASFGLEYQRGVALHGKGQSELAYQSFKAALARAANADARSSAMAALGKLALEQAQYDEAIHWLTKAVAKHPTRYEARLDLGMAYLAKLDLMSAKRVFDALLAEQRIGAAYYGRARALHGLKRKQEALADIRQAMESGLNDPNLGAWLNKISAMP